MPRIGHRREDLTNEDLNAWPVSGYLVIYEPGTNPLLIVRVLHGSRDLRSLLDDGDDE